jgi:hypothetical protein
MTKIRDLHRRWSKDVANKGAYVFEVEVDLARTLIETTAAKPISDAAGQSG